VCVFKGKEEQQSNINQKSNNKRDKEEVSKNKI